VATNLHRGVAGGSAQREYERRKADREERIRTAHPRTGNLIIALTDEPQDTTSWAKGAEGERVLGAQLDGLASAGVIVLHDRRRPGTTANIDHVAVTPSGVWVIDAKHYHGQVTRRRRHLYVGRRDCTKLVTAMAKQVDAVRTALGESWQDVPVWPVLCFVGAKWGWFAKPFPIDGVLVTWPEAACELLVRRGEYSTAAIGLIAAKLDARLKPAA
jgi:hypothetical protein